MIRNYIKIAWRNLNRNKVSSIINISGLSIGLACVMLIGLYVKDELSYDSFFKESKSIYRVNLDIKMGNEEVVAGHTPPPVGAALTSNFPEIASYTRIFKPGDEIIHFEIKGQKNSLTEKNLLSVDSNFLQFFDYKLIAGNAATCLQSTNSVVLTEKSAKKYFGSADVLGKTLVFDEYKEPFTVTGVLADLPAQSSLQFDVLQSNTGMPPVKRFGWSWIWLQMGTYVKLRPGTPNDIGNIKRLEAKFPAMVTRQAAAAFARVGQPLDEFKRKGGRWELHLQPLTEVHLNSANVVSRFIQNGDIKNVYIFSAAALFIMLLACVNFMNLSTAQSAKRGKEVGIRKVLGSERGQLIRQFISEAMLYTLLATAIAIVLVILVLPVFNQISNKSLSLQMFYSASTWGYLLLVVLITGLLAGSYPAFFLTSLKPVSVLKGGGFFKSGSLLTRNALIVFQFFISTTLIICTIVVYKQLKFNQTKDLGLDKRNVIIISNTGRLNQSEESYRQELLKLPEVVNASITSGVPSGGSFGDFYVPEVDPNNTKLGQDNIALSSFMVDEAFMPTLGLKMDEGRMFSKTFADSASVIINQTAARQIGWKQPIGKSMTYPGNGNQKFTVIGVVKDFNTESLHSAVAPFALFYTTSKTYRIRSSYITVRIKPSDYSKTISMLQSKWKQFLPDTPFDYSFLDANFDALYRADQTVGQVFSVFTGLSLIVACLGLLGLAIYTAERRTKEIGIRKVLGASVQNVVQMLSKDFLKLVIIASVIAFPLAWYGMNIWLQDFAYKTTISWWVFALAGGITVVITLLTVSFQSIKAAMANPVKSLRSE